MFHVIFCIGGFTLHCWAHNTLTPSPMMLLRVGTCEILARYHAPGAGWYWNPHTAAINIPIYFLTYIFSHYFKKHIEIFFKGVLHLWALFLKTLCIFSKNKATLDKVSYGSGQNYSKELRNHSFTSVETIVVKLQWKMCENQYFPCFEP